MKVLALIEAPEHVSYRYRIEPFAWGLAERDLYLETVPLSGGAFRRIGPLWAARRAAAVVLQRRLLPAWQLALLRRMARFLIYDLDDAVFQHGPGSNGFSRRALAGRFRATVRAADLVIAGNEYLKECAAAVTEPGRVAVVPTCIEPKWYPPATHWRCGSAARMVWIGRDDAAKRLNGVREHLAAATARLPGLQLRVMGGTVPALEGVRVVPRRWSPASRAADLAEGDIGIAWLPDDERSRGHCGLEVLQCMAAGLPVVANPVGIHRRLIIPGETGLLASTPAEWGDAIGRLAANPLLRRRLGAAARQMVEQQFSVAGWEPRWVTLVEAVARGTLVPADTEWLPGTAHLKPAMKAAS